MTARSPELLRVVGELVTHASQDRPAAFVYAAVCAGAVEVIEGCDHASLMVVGRGGIRTAAASDRVAELCDELEISLGQGACVDVLDDDEPEWHLCDDLASTRRWPSLSQAVRLQTPVRGVAGVRLRGDGRKLGALNLFSDTPGALTETAVEQAQLLGAFVSVTLLAETHQREAATLRDGLRSNRTIGAAVGLIMASHNLSHDAAFDVLSRLSQDMNVKLASVAGEILAGHEAGSVEGTPRVDREPDEAGRPRGHPAT